MRLCNEHYVSGCRLGQPCPYQATTIIVGPGSGLPFLVCGYHARAWTPEAQYPLDWSPARIRRWRLQNLEEFTRRASLRAGTDD